MRRQFGHYAEEFLVLIGDKHQRLRRRRLHDFVCLLVGLDEREVALRIALVGRVDLGAQHEVGGPHVAREELGLRDECRPEVAVGEAPALVVGREAAEARAVRRVERVQRDDGLQAADACCLAGRDHLVA